MAQNSMAKNSMTNITFEEQQLIALYNSGGSRVMVLAELKEIRTYMNREEPLETAMIGLIDSTVAKLERMSDEDFSAFDLFPDFVSEEDDAE